MTVHTMGNEKDFLLQKEIEIVVIHSYLQSKF
jgi:hypothetical protein